MTSHMAEVPGPMVLRQSSGGVLFKHAESSLVFLDDQSHNRQSAFLLKAQA